MPPSLLKEWRHRFGVFDGGLQPGQSYGMCLLATALKRIVHDQQVTVALEDGSGRLLCVEVPDYPFGHLAKDLSRYLTGSTPSKPADQSTDGLYAIVRSSRRDRETAPQTEYEFILDSVDGCAVIEASTRGHLSADTTLRCVQSLHHELVEHGLDSPGIDIVPEEMRNEIIRRSLGLKHCYPLDIATTRDLIERTVSENPTKIAITFEEQNLTYGDLDGKANAVAGSLLEQGVHKGATVGLLIGNSLEYPIALLAAMKVGATFIPLDQQWPDKRLQAIISGARPRALLVGPSTRPSVEAADRVVIVDESVLPSVDLTPVAVYGADLAYGFPTSGSSGEPKCALNIHRGLLNRLLYMTRRYGSTAGKVTLQNSRHVFDSSLWQLLWPLTIGGRVVIPQPTSHLDLDATTALIEQHDVTMTDFVPSVFNALVEMIERDQDMASRLTSLQHLLIGGEEISGHHCHRFRRIMPNTEITNTYGPTEAAIGMVFHAVAPDDLARVPIGRPIDNTFAIVLDRELRIMPPGAIGELFVGGDCLGIGYLNDAERTSQAWLTNPYNDQLPGQHIYRTGDLAYSDDAGLLHFVGREDTQVKVGGVRIELGEIERVISECPGVRQAVVCVIDGAAGARLIAYVAGTNGLGRDEVADHLAKHLPTSQLPSRIELRDELPLTHNGKLDRQQLQRSSHKSASSEGTAQSLQGGRELLVDRMLKIMRELLGIDDIAADDDFFDSGGDSLLAVQVVLDVERQLGVPLSIQDVYAHPTAKGLISHMGLVAKGSVKKPRQSGAVSRDLHMNEELTSAPATSSQSTDLRKVLMTGASGYIGAHVLVELLSRSSVEVVCVARCHQGQDGLAHILTQAERYGLCIPSNHAKRIRVIEGDWTQRRYGLPAAIWTKLCSDIDAIVHCAGAVDFLQGYEYHRDANVVSTAALIELASQGHPKVMHHLSSTIALDNTQDTICTRLDQWAVASGYAASKWVADQLVIDAAERGVQAVRYYVGEAMPHSQYGVPNERSLAYLLIATVIQMACYPWGTIQMDYTPVDYIAAEICENLLAASHPARAVSLYRPGGIALDAIVAALHANGAPAIRGISEADFLTALAEKCHGRGRSREAVALLSVVNACTAKNTPTRQATGGLASLFSVPGDYVCGSKPSGTSISSMDGEPLRSFCRLMVAQHHDGKAQGSGDRQPVLTGR